VASYIYNLDEPLESGALPRLVGERQLVSYHHDGFWQPMDTLREKEEIEKLSQELMPPWLSIPSQV
jgi:glucose-1-phosphate cytidylyltransferase